MDMDMDMGMTPGDFEEDAHSHEQVSYDTYKSTCFAWYQYSGVSYGFSPVTFEGMLLVASWSFLTLLLVSGYTANLAQVLISESELIPKLQSIASARAKNTPLCANQGYADVDLIKGLFKVPAVNLQEIPTNYKGLSEPWTLAQAIRDGVCDGAILSMHQAQELLMTEKECDLELFGGVLTPAGAGFGVRSALVNAQADGHCELVGEVMQVIERRLHEEAKINSLYAEFLTAINVADCSADIPTSSGPTKLTAKDMMGSFVVHGIVILMCGLLRAKRLLLCKKDGDVPAADPEGKPSFGSVEEALAMLMMKVENLDAKISQQQPNGPVPDTKLHTAPLSVQTGRPMCSTNFM